MYSKNDYRNYLIHRLEESDDYLAHYGVKGMKWKDHQYVIDPRLRERMAKGLGTGGLFSTNSKTGVKSRVNAAKRKATFGVGKRLVKSPTGRKLLKAGVKYQLNRGKKNFKKEVRKAYKGQKKDIQRIAKNVRKSEAMRTAKRGANEFKKEVRDAYNGQKKDIQRIAKNAKNSKAVKTAKRGANEFRKEVRDAYNGQKKDIQRIAKNAKNSKTVQNAKKRVNSAKNNFGKAKKASDVAGYKFDNGEVRGRAVAISGKKRTVAVGSGKNIYTGGKSHRIDVYDNATGEKMFGKSITKKSAYDSWHVGSKVSGGKRKRKRR